jgi:CysZ protein
MYLAKGFRLLTHRKLLPYVVGPIVVNIALLYFGWWILYDWLSSWADNWLTRLPDWLNFIADVMQWVFVVAAIIISALIFNMIATLIGSPFYGLMAEQVCNIHKHPVKSSALTTNNIASLIAGALLREFQKLFYYFSRLIPLLIVWLVIFFTPLSPLMTIVWFLFGARMLALDYTDFAFDNEGISFKESKRIIKAHNAESLIFGGTVTLATMIPLVNVFAVPAAVIGGTLFYIDLHKSRT